MEVANSSIETEPQGLVRPSIMSSQCEWDLACDRGSKHSGWCTKGCQSNRLRKTGQTCPLQPLDSRNKMLNPSANVRTKKRPSTTGTVPCKQPRRMSDAAGDVVNNPRMQGTSRGKTPINKGHGKAPRLMTIPSKQPRHDIPANLVFSVSDESVSDESVPREPSPVPTSPSRKRVQVRNKQHRKVNNNTTTNVSDDHIPEITHQHSQVLGIELIERESKLHQGLCNLKNQIGAIDNNIGIFQTEYDVIATKVQELEVKIKALQKDQDEIMTSQSRYEEQKLSIQKAFQIKRSKFSELQLYKEKLLNTLKDYDTDVQSDPDSLADTDKELAEEEATGTVENSTSATSPVV